LNPPEGQGACAKRAATEFAFFSELYLISAAMSYRYPGPGPDSLRGSPGVDGRLQGRRQSADGLCWVPQRSL